MGGAARVSTNRARSTRHGRSTADPDERVEAKDARLKKDIGRRATQSDVVRGALEKSDEANLSRGDDHPRSQGAHDERSGGLGVSENAVDIRRSAASKMK